MKHGIVSIVPKIYQGARFPILVEQESLAIPIKGVVIPSVIYPESKVKPAIT